MGGIKYLRKVAIYQYFIYVCLSILIKIHFPMQNFEKILSSKSSVVMVPVISPR